MKKRTVILGLLFLVLAGCSSPVKWSVTKLYEGDPLPENKIVHIEGIGGIFGWGIATAICGVDGQRFDPCLASVGLLPGRHTIEVRYLYGNESRHAKVYRTYVMDFAAGSRCIVALKRGAGIPDRDPYIQCRAGGR